MNVLRQPPHGSLRGSRTPRPRKPGLRNCVGIIGLLGIAGVMSPALTAVAGATGGPTLAPLQYSYDVAGGTTFALDTHLLIQGAPEARPVTMTVTPDPSYPGLTFLDVPAQATPGWNCSASNISLQVASCTYTPTSPLPVGSELVMYVDATTVASSSYYVVLTDTSASSPDGTGFPLMGYNIIGVDTPADTTPPVVTNAAVSPTLTALGAGATLTATASDSETNGTAIASADYNINGGPWMAMSPSDGAFDSTSENVKATLPAPTSPVADTICVRATDVAGNVSDGTACTTFVAYDPTAGFVTGGGWIASPAGACLDTTICSDTVAKGTFGFVSKCQKGASIPTGNTQYVFHDGNLNFASSAYQWLIVNQNKTNAQFKGTGSINGSPGYNFMIWATTGSASTFRIQITRTTGGATVYDTGTEPLGGGSILIHA